MHILDDKGLSGIVKRFLDVVFLGGIGIFIALPYVTRWYLEKLYKVTSEKYWFLLPFLYITGFLALMIVNELRRIFGTLNKRNPFTMINVKSLKRMAIASFAISVAYIVKIFLFNSFLTIILTMVFIIVGLFCIILAEVFRQAVIVKEENDLTV
jgi:hypothetical protein